MRITKKGALVIFLGIQIIVINILKYTPQFVETFYSNGLYIFFSKLTRYSFGWIPFSVGDIFYAIVIIYLIHWLYKNFKRIYRDTLKWFLDVFAAISIAYFAFHMLWAFNYYRLPLHKSMNLKANYTTEELIDFSKQLVLKSNEIHAQLSSKNDSLSINFPYSKKEIFDMVENGYDNISIKFPHLKYKPKSLKKSLFSTILTYMGFSGYINPFTNEAQVNGLNLTYKYPTTSCHEIAHQLGYAAENEANFIGALAAINNDDLYFKYSGYTFSLRYCLGEIYKRSPGNYPEILESINIGILNNYQEVRDFWSSYETPIEPFFEKTFDTFLKANNQTKGMDSYNYVVALLVNYYKNNSL